MEAVIQTELGGRNPSEVVELTLVKGKIGLATIYPPDTKSASQNGKHELQPSADGDRTRLGSTQTMEIVNGRSNGNGELLVTYGHISGLDAHFDHLEVLCLSGVGLSSIENFPHLLSLKKVRSENRNPSSCMIKHSP